MILPSFYKSIALVSLRNCLNEQLRKYLEISDAKLVHIGFKHSFEFGREKLEPMIKVYQLS